MSTNKNAVIRYHALDRCLSNFYKRYTIKDLIKACNAALSEINPTIKEFGVQRRQIFNDIKFMEAEAGYAAPIERIRDGQKTYYRYADPHYSIRKQPINATEAQQLTDAITMLSRFKGLPNFEWMEEVIGKLESIFEINHSSTAVVGFDQNIDLQGLKFFSPIFNAIIAHKLLKIKYKPFDKPAQNFTLSPYYLKQYNNRWFLFGWCNEWNKLYNLPLDRINTIKELKGTYRENTDIDFAEYFDDIVGVTHPENRKEITVTLQVKEDFIGYLWTKPIHWSLKKRPDNIFTLKVIPNYELETYLFSHSDKIKILSPDSLQEAIRKRIEEARELQEAEMGE